EGLLAAPGAGHLAGDRGFESVVLLILILGEGRGGHGRGSVLVHGLLVDREDLRGAVALLELKVACRLELHGLVVRVVVGQRDVHLEVGVVEDVLLPRLRGGRGRRGERLLGRRRLGGGGLVLLMLSSLRGASSIESACPSPSPAAPCRL